MVAIVSSGLLADVLWAPTIPLHDLCMILDNFHIDCIDRAAFRIYE